MKKILVNFTVSLDILSVWYTICIFIMTFTLKHLMK